MHRRTILTLGAVSVASGYLPHGAWAQAPADALDYADFNGGPPPDFQLYGTNPPTDLELQKAKNILDGAPKSGSIISVAKYFEGITDKNKDGESFNAAWRTRWNPVITDFYNSTSLKQKLVYTQGDTVAWCAAFLNWSLARVGKKGTNNAMSGSFRLGPALGTETKSPQPGDIIVFKLRKANPDVGHGHVGIYMGETADSYVVLGGNQKAGKRYSSVNTTKIPKSGYVLQQVSFRQYSTIPLAT